MKRGAVLLALAVVPTACAQGQQSSVVAEAALDGLEDDHWFKLYERAGELQAAGKIDEATLAFYAGQYRARVLVQCLKPPEDGEPALLASMNATLGLTINRSIGRSAKRLVGAIDGALAWTEAHPDPATAAATCAPFHASQRAGLVSLRDGIAADPQALRTGRTANGLPNDPE